MVIWCVAKAGLGELTQPRFAISTEIACDALLQDRLPGEKPRSPEAHTSSIVLQGNDRLARQVRCVAQDDRRSRAGTRTTEEGQLTRRLRPRAVRR